MSKETLRDLLMSQQRENYFVGLLAREDPKYVAFEAITVPSFQNGRFYICWNGIGSPGRRFVVFVDDDSKKVAVLTQSAEGLGVALRAQRDLNFGALDQRLLSADLFRLYRPDSSSFVLLDADGIEANHIVKGMDVRIDKGSDLSVSDDGKDLALVWALRVGSSLVVMSLKASTTGSVQITELLRVGNVFNVSSPH